MRLLRRLGAAAFVAGMALSGCATLGDPQAGRAPGVSAAMPLSAALCDRAKVLDARQQDRLLRFAAVVRDELERAHTEVALISRSGIDLSRFGVRLSHSGVALKEGGAAAWTVRQLYYACDEGRPLLYDQGLAGFVFGSDQPDAGRVSVVLLPGADARALEQAALDRERALRLLAARYSAIAYPFSVRYQNCNQWVMELLAAAWGGLDDGEDLRQRAQDWLLANAYAPVDMNLDSHWLKFAGSFVPLLRLDDHPDDERTGLRLRTSLPEAIESFVHQRRPAARRLELCHDEHRVVVRHGWEPIADGCRPAAGDRVIALD